MASSVVRWRYRFPTDTCRFSPILPLQTPAYQRTLPRCFAGEKDRRTSHASKLPRRAPSGQPVKAQSLRRSIFFSQVVVTSGRASRLDHIESLLKNRCKIRWLSTTPSSAYGRRPRPIANNLLLTDNESRNLLPGPRVRTVPIEQSTPISPGKI